jgi:flagellar biogenesis protein FliO
MKNTTILLAVLLMLGLRVATHGAEQSASSQETNLPPQAALTNNAIPWHFTSPVVPAKAEFSVWRSIGSLLIVLGCLMAVTWLMKKRAWGVGGMRSQRRLQIIEKLPLGPRQYLALVRVDGADMLIGISHERITELGCTSAEDFEKAANT